MTVHSSHAHTNRPSVKTTCRSGTNSGLCGHLQLAACRPRWRAALIRRQQAIHFKTVDNKEAPEGANERASLLWGTKGGKENKRQGKVTEVLLVRQEHLSQWATRSRERGWRWKSRRRDPRRRPPSSCRSPWSGWWPQQGCQTAAGQQSARWSRSSSPPARTAVHRAHYMQLFLIIGWSIVKNTSYRQDTQNKQQQTCQKAQWIILKSWCWVNGSHPKNPKAVTIWNAEKRNHKALTKKRSCRFTFSVQTPKK